MPSLALQIKSKQVEEAKRGEEGVKMNLGRKGNSHSSGKFLCVFLVIFLSSVYMSL